MSIADDGIGLSDEYEDSGRGISNMRTDAERLGGILEVGPDRFGRGTTVITTVPVKVES